MSRFWKYQIRYRLARRLIHVGLFVLPNGRYKDELLASLWGLYEKVCRETILNETPAMCSPAEKNRDAP